MKYRLGTYGHRHGHRHRDDLCWLCDRLHLVAAVLHSPDHCQAGHTTATCRQKRRGRGGAQGGLGGGLCKGRIVGVIVDCGNMH
jgi:hypothetical protein